MGQHKSKHPPTCSEQKHAKCPLSPPRGRGATRRQREEARWSPMPAWQYLLLMFHKLKWECQGMIRGADGSRRCHPVWKTFRKSLLWKRSQKNWGGGMAPLSVWSSLSQSGTNVRVRFQQMIKKGEEKLLQSLFWVGPRAHDILGSARDYFCVSQQFFKIFMQS